MSQFHPPFAFVRTFVMLCGAATLLLACEDTEQSTYRSVQLQLRFQAPAAERSSTEPFLALAGDDGDLRGIGEFTDVARVQVDVIDAESEQIFLNNLELAEGPEEVWAGTIAALPADRMFRFFAEALDEGGALLFSGQVEIELTEDNQVIEIPLAPEQDGGEFDLPRLVRISYQDAVATGQSMPVAFTVEADPGTTVALTITAETGEAPFAPSQRSITLSAPVADFVAQYAAPVVDMESDLRYHVLLVAELAQSSLAVDTEFVIHVVPQSTVVDDVQPVILFNPVILSLDGALRSGDDTLFYTPDDQVRLEATVSDNGPQIELTYAWSFEPSPGTDPGSFANMGAGNPGFLQAYDPALEGQISLAVTDGDGGTTTLFYNLVPDQFANAFDDNEIAQVVAGDSHTCVRTTAGRVHCWGLNDFGQLGHGNTTTIGDDPGRLPYTAGDVPLPASDPAAQITAGANHTCALLRSGMAYCWGRNTFGQLGYGSTESIGDDEAVTSAGFINAGGLLRAIAAGENHTCAVLSESGEVRCWGQNDHGQLGRGDSEPFGDSADEPTSAAISVPLGGAQATALALGSAIAARCSTTAASAAGAATRPVSSASAAPAPTSATSRQT